MQYSLYTVSVTNNSNVVTGAAGTKFLTNVRVGYAFKIKGDPTLYQVAAVISDTELRLSVPYAGSTVYNSQYQITTDYTPNFELAEINIGDQDWPFHLTVGALRKIDSILGGISTGLTFIGSWNASTNSPPLPAASSVNAGHIYKVSVTGTTTINGISQWCAGDSAISNGTIWIRVPAPETDVLTSAQEAAASAASAATSATTATTKAGEAATSATNAANSASSASSSAVSASNSAATLAASLQAFQQTFLGRFATDPLVDNQGNPLLDGTTYINTVSDKIRVYSAETSTWKDYDEAAQTATTSANLAATNAAASAVQAAGSASTASAKATEALTSATNAATFANTATTKASDATTSATNAAASAATATTKASDATTAANTATTKAAEASTSATNAAGSATTATTKASEASTSATSAATSAATATTKAAEATDSATTANTAKLAAEAARDQALTAFDSFDDRYLGQKATDPTVDNDGNPLAPGALYFNTAAIGSGGGMKVFDGSAWVAAYASIDPTLTALAAVTTAADKLIYATGVDTFATATLTSTARALLDDTSTSEMRTTLGLGTAATTAATDYAIAANGVTNGNSHDHVGGDGAAISLTSAVTGILPVASGGTGSSTQNFVDLTSNQTIGGVKTFSSNLILGTPASGDLRNCSLAVAPAIGGTTPNSGAFTSLSASGAVTTASQLKMSRNLTDSASRRNWCWDTEHSVIGDCVLLVSTSNTGDPASGTAVLSAHSSGNVLIGTTTDNGVNKLQVSGSGYFSSSVGIGGVLSVAGSVSTGYSTVSGAGNASINTTYFHNWIVTGGATNYGTVRMTDNATYSAFINWNNAGLQLVGPGATSGIILPPSGNLLVGTTTDDGVNKLQVNGGGYFSKSASGATAEILRLANTGSGANTAAQLVFAAAGTGYARITGGYGAAAPVLKYDVITGGSHVWQVNSTDVATLTSSGLSVTGSVTVDSRILLTTSTSPNAQGQIGYNTLGGLYLWPKAGSTHDFILYRSDGNVALALASSGNLLVGTTTDRNNTPFVVEKSSSGWCALFRNSPSAAGVYIGSDSSEYSRISSVNSDFSAYKALALNPSGGNVLIGTTTDDGVNKLQVNGSGYFADGIKIGANSTATAGKLFNNNTWGMGFAAVSSATNAFGWFDHNVNQLMALSSTGLIVGTTDSTSIVSAGGLNTHLTVQAVGPDGSVIFKTNGTERARVTSTGLSVTGSITSVASTGAGSVTLGDTSHYGVISSGGTGSSIYLNGASRVGAGTAEARATVFATDGKWYWTDSTGSATRMSLSSSTGNLPVGTTTDDGVNKLQVNGSVKFSGNIHSASAFWLKTQSTSSYTGVYFEEGNYVDFCIGSQSRCRVSSTGLSVTGSNVLGANSTVGALGNITMRPDLGGAGTYSRITINCNQNADVLDFQYNGTQVGRINLGTSATTYVTSSDYRLKDDYKPLATPVDRVKQLKPVNFAWKSTGERCDGFIAHELQEVFPDAVSGEKDSVDVDGKPLYQGVEYGRITPLLVAVIQELTQRIEALEGA